MYPPRISGAIGLAMVIGLAGGAGIVHADTASVCPFEWQRALRPGTTGPDVVALQHFLSVEPASGYFGSVTAQAVRVFQRQQGLPSVGFVGPRTRANLNASCLAPVLSSMPNATSSAESTAQPQDVLTVSDPGQPDASLAPAGAGVLFLQFDLQAGSRDIHINGVTIERTGLGSNAAFASFGLYDEDGLQIGPVSVLNTNNRTTFKRPFTIPAGQKRSFQVYANMEPDLTSYDGQKPAIRLVDVSATSPLEGTLPISGTPQTLNTSLLVGGATALLSQDDPGANATRFINEKGVKFAGIRITANSHEDLTLDGIIWTQAGTVARADLSEVKTVVDGAEYSTTPSPYNDHEYVTMFNPGIIIKKGDTANVFIKGDINPTAANRTITFNINDINDEVPLTGNSYGFGVGLSPAGNTATEGGSVFLTSDGTTDGTTLMPFFSGSTISVVPGGVISIMKN